MKSFASLRPLHTPDIVWKAQTVLTVLLLAHFELKKTTKKQQLIELNISCIIINIAICILMYNSKHECCKHRTKHVERKAQDNQKPDSYAADPL